MPRWSPVPADSDPVLVSLADAKLHLRIDHTEEDTLIGGLIATASGFLDGPGRVLGRAGIRRVWRATLGSDEARPNLLPCLRLLGDIEFVGLDVFSGGAWQAVPAVDCRLVRSTLGFIVHPAPGAVWPQPDEAVSDLYRVSVRTGFSDEASDELDLLKSTALLLIGTLYAYRDGNAGDVLASGTFHLLLSPLRDAW